jgi:hypothetical protein
MDTDLLDGILISLEPYDLQHCLQCSPQTMEILPMIPMTFEIEIHLQLANYLFQMCI